MTYAIFKREEIFSGAYRICALRQEDMESIRQWRNEQMDVLRQESPLSPEDQQNYFSNVVTPSFGEQEPRIILVSFLKDCACIGYGGLTNIDWQARRAEVSFLLATTRTVDPNLYQKEFGIFLELLKELAFKDLGLHRLFTETFDIRPLHVSVLEAHGFVPECRLRNHVFIGGKFVDSLMHGCLSPN